MHYRAGFVAIILALAGLLGGAAAQAQSTQFLVSVKGAAQGQFRGESVDKRYNGWIPGLAFNYAVKSPRDVASGAQTGPRVNGPIAVTKRWGSSSPQLFQALVTAEPLPEVLIRFIARNGAGMDYAHHTLRLTNAFVTAIRHDTDYLSVPPRSDLETVEFVFQQIEVIDDPSQARAADLGSVPALAQPKLQLAPLVP